MVITSKLTQNLTEFHKQNASYFLISEHTTPKPGSEVFAKQIGLQK